MTLAETRGFFLRRNLGLGIWNLCPDFYLYQMRKILLLSTFVLLQSCQIAGLTNDYSKLSAGEKALIVDGDSFDKTTTTKIYKITGTQLRDDIAKQPKAFVYVFTNGCHSPNCKPMKVYEIYAKEHGYKLYLVMSGYGNLHETLEQRNAFESPLYAIKTEAYDSRYRTVFERCFSNELVQRPKKEGRNGCLFFFENGKFVSESWELPNG
jgi:hypothetical protein